MSGRPDPNEDEARRRLAGASATLESARHQLSREDLPAGIACFLAHLAAEKALKALLVALEQPFKKIHDLVELQRLIVARGLSLQIGEENLDMLNPWSIDGRYAEDVPETSRALARKLVGVSAAVLTAAEQAMAHAAVFPRPAEQLLDGQEIEE